METYIFNHRIYTVNITNIHYIIDKQVTNSFQPECMIFSSKIHKLNIVDILIVIDLF